MNGYRAIAESAFGGIGDRQIADGERWYRKRNRTQRVGDTDAVG